MADNTPTWCRTCDTRHDLGPRCPGELLATGPERFGWRIAVQTGGGRTEELAVLVAPSNDLWRARVITLPNMLWCVPGGRGTLKFAARSATAVEKLAQEYIIDVCRHRGYKRSLEHGQVKSGAYTLEAGAQRPVGAKDERLLHELAVRFGEERADRTGSTGDLSNGGMFVVTDRPLPQGRRVRLVLELDEARLPLQGIVAWVRAKQEDGRQSGMGVQLIAPPALYKHFVTRISAARGCVPEPETEQTPA